MAGFDPSEYEAFLAQSAGGGTRGRAPTTAAPSPFAPPAAVPVNSPGGFDPNEYESFLASSAAPAPVASAASFDQRFAGDNSAPALTARTADASRSALGRGLQAQADERLIGSSGAGNQIAAAVRAGGNMAGLNLPRNIGAAIASIPGIGNGRPFGENYQLAADQDAALARQNPKSALAGDVAGIVGGAVALPGFSGGSTLIKRAGQAALTGFGYGAAAEAFDSKDIGRSVASGLVSAGVGAALSPAIEKAAPHLMRLIQSGRPVRDASGAFSADAVDALRAAGVDPSTLAPEAADQIAASFAAKGVSPAAAREAQAAAFGIPLSRGQATLDPAALALERQSVAGSRGNRAQAVGDEFMRRQGEAVDEARVGILGRLAGGGSVLDNPNAAAEMIADRARGLADDNAFRVAAAQRGADTALEQLRGPMPPDALDAATAAAQALREAAGQRKAAYQGAYADLAAYPGEFVPGALDKMGTRVRRGLGADVPVDPVLTPAAARALDDLDSLPGLFGAEGGTGPNLQQLDQVRKRLVSYRSGTGQNATDRRAMGRILDEFDNHTQAALEAGLFGPRQAAPRAAGAADDFPGLPADDVPFPGLPAAAPASGRERGPETLIQFLARQGGIRATGDARAADLHRVMTGTGPLARLNGRSVDELRVPLMEEGFLPPDADGGMARNITNELYDLIRRERAGEPTYRASDVNRAAAMDRGGRAGDADAAYAERLGEFTDRARMELESTGLRARDLDPAALRDAAESLMLGQADDVATAYERAVMSRPGQTGPAPRLEAPEAAPFPGEGAARVADTTALPGGSTEPAEVMRKARGLFADYQRTFRPQGPGDDVGRAVQRIIERDAQPGEVASMLFGGSRAGNTGLSVRLAERIKGTLGEDSPGWQAVQQGLVSKVLETRGGGDVAGRIEHLLKGDGRTLAARILSPEQRAGLEVYRRGVVQAEATRTALPAWVSDLARTGFDPNRVTAGLFGSGIPGSRVGSAEYAKTLKQTFGANSAEWSNLRQAAWLNLTGEGGAARLPALKEAERIRAFTGGEGKGLARQMFTGEELAVMNRYADAVRATHVPNGSRLADGGRSQALAAQAMNLIAGAVGFKIGGPAGAAAAYGVKAGQRVLQGGLNGARASRSFDGGAPRVRAPLPVAPAAIPARVGVAAGILPFGALVPR